MRAITAKSMRLFATVCGLVLAVASGARGETIAGYSPEQAIRLGEIMYQKGLLPSGAPLKAVVQGDIELSGTMSTCANCHLRSGLGSLEGGVLTPPTTGVKLYAPLTGPADIPGSPMKRSGFKTARPAYTDATLVEALQNGIGPGGARMGDTMPRYLMDADSAALLTYYLKQLSSRVSPGVTADEIRFATIVSRELPEADRKALVEPMKAYFREEWNPRLKAQLRQQEQTGTGQAGVNAYRTATLDVWELAGPPETWPRQLEEFSVRRPVFAILGGMVAGPWAPVHGFCEKNRIPCIFPFTNQPVVNDTDWYTLYLSKGLYQEGEAAAKYLSRVLDLPRGKKVVQLYRENDDGALLARGFAETWQKLGNASLSGRVLSRKERPGPGFWKGIARKYPDAVLLVWLGAGDLEGIDALAAGGKKKPLLIASTTRLGNSLASLPDAVRDITLLTYPTRLPEEGEYTRSLVASWHKYKNMPVTNPRIAAHAFLIVNLLSKVLIEMGGDLYRDYFLDIWDSGKDETNSSATYPVISFGPGQRYAAKGCYLVSLARGTGLKIIRQSDWVIY